MIMTDPIADMLTRVRNALQARHETVEIPANKEKVEIAKILKNEGFITDYTVDGDVKKTITVTLKYGPNNEKENLKTRFTCLRKGGLHSSRNERTGNCNHLYIPRCDNR